MSVVMWVGIATGEAMGLQGYERSVQASLRALAPADLRFESVQVTSLRGHPAQPARRTLMGAAGTLPSPLARVLGGLTYRTGNLVHRFDLRLPPAAGAEIVTVHDLPALHHSDEAPVPRSAAAGARRARAVICPSTCTATELIEVFGLRPERVHVIPNGVGAEFLRAGAAAGRPGPRGRYVVHAAGATARKNLPALAAAWAEIVRRRPDTTLVLCGSADPRRDAAFRDLTGIVHAGHLGPVETAALMTGAAAVVVPSTYEGFGLPALEGMAAGAPVVAARRGALPEVCGDAALLVEPTPEGLSRGLMTVLDDAAAARSLVARGRARAAAFTWERSALAHLEVYRRALGRGPASNPLQAPVA